MSAADEHPAPPQELPMEAYLAALASLDLMGPARMRWLLRHGTPEEVWRSLARGQVPDPSRVPGPSDGAATKWRAEAPGIDPARLWRRCIAEGVGVVSLGSPGYPPSLADDLEPPVVLFHRGTPGVADGPRAAVVGTRRATGYGLRVAEELGASLTAAGAVVVSGLALGIDAAAHRGALRGADPRPVAVVGAGLDAPCPRRNRALAAQVARAGVLLSEVPPGVEGRPWRFPVRNRVIAALADVLVVVESTASGGSMHTVREAMRRDRPVFAVPGPITSGTSRGTNELLRDGAEPMLEVADVVEVLGLARAPVFDQPEGGTRRRTPSGAAAAVLDAIEWRPVTPAQLADACGLGLSELSAALSWLEQHGWIRRSGGWIERVSDADGVRGRVDPGA